MATPSETIDAIELARELVGKPFAWHGRGPEAYDCWGLVRECLLRSGVADVPDYRSATEGAANAATILEAMGRGWQKLARGEPGAVVVIEMPANGRGERHWHVGYMLTRDLFLHTTEQTHGAVIERISSPLWQRLVVGFYRWEPKSL